MDKSSLIKYIKHIIILFKDNTLDVYDSFEATRFNKKINEILYDKIFNPIYKLLDDYEENIFVITGENNILNSFILYFSDRNTMSLHMYEEYVDYQTCYNLFKKIFKDEKIKMMYVIVTYICQYLCIYENINEENLLENMKSINQYCQIKKIKLIF